MEECKRRCTTSAGPSDIVRVLVHGDLHCQESRCMVRAADIINYTFDHGAPHQDYQQTLVPSLLDRPCPKSHTLGRNPLGLILWGEMTRAIRVGVRRLPPSLAAEQGPYANNGL